VLVKLQLTHPLELLGLQDESLKHFIVDQGTLLCNVLILLDSLFFRVDADQLDLFGQPGRKLILFNLLLLKHKGARPFIGEGIEGLDEVLIKVILLRIVTRAKTLQLSHAV
jgi:hypothetical protein